MLAACPLTDTNLLNKPLYFYVAFVKINNVLQTTNVWFMISYGIAGFKPIESL